MQPSAIRKRIGTTSVISSLVGRLGEYVVDTTKKTLVILDGTTAGGTPLALETHIHSNATESIAGFLSASDKTSLDGLISSAGGSVTPQASVNTPNTLVKRDGSGNFAAGTITASLAGQAASVLNGVVTSGSYTNPGWITTLAASKLTGVISIAVPWSVITGAPLVPTNVSQLTNDSHFITNTGSTSGTAGSVITQTASPTPSTVIVRDGSGRAQVITPIANADIATKAYVDAASSAGNNILSFSTPGTFIWTVPALLNYVSVFIVAGGGPGSGSMWDGSQAAAGTGGGAGACGFLANVAVTPGSSVTVVVGSGGIANITAPASLGAELVGTPGGFSRFNTVTMPGGSGATVITGSSNGGIGGGNNASSPIPSPSVIGHSWVYAGANGSTAYAPPGPYGSNITGGGGSAPGFAPNSSHAVVGQQAASGSTRPIAGVSDFIPSTFGVTNGGGSLIDGGTLLTPGIGGGGYGQSYQGTGAGYSAGQNGGPGLVVIFW